jgi:hypothetical protein
MADSTWRAGEGVRRGGGEMAFLDLRMELRL